MDTYDIYVIDPYDDSDSYTILDGHSNLTLGKLLEEVVKLSSGDWGVTICLHGTSTELVAGYTKMPMTDTDSGSFVPFRDYV